MLKKNENEKFSDYRHKYSKLIEKIFNSHSKIPFQLTSDQLIQIPLKHKEISIDLFLKTFFKSFDDSQSNKEKSDLIYYVYKILSFLFIQKKFKIKKIESNYVANGINTFFYNYDEIILLEPSEEKILVTLRLTHLFLKIASDQLKLENLLQFSKFLIDLTVINSKYQNVKLKEFSHYIVIKILEELNVKFLEIVELSKSNSQNSSDNYGTNERESARKDVKTFMKSFYFGIYDVEFLISKSICANIVNNLTMKSYLIPEQSSSDIFLMKMKQNFKFSSGRFGKCEICKSNANFYCVKTRLPICSSQCKEKLRCKETFYEFVHVNYILDKQTSSENSSQTLADIKSIKEFSENLLLALINELSNINISSPFRHSPQRNNKIKNSETSNKYKEICEIISKTFTEMNLLIDNTFFEQISHRLFKTIFKCILFCDENLLSVINHLIMDTVKYFGRVIKSQLKTLFYEGIKIIDPKSFFSVGEKKVEFFLKLFVSIFLLHGDTFIFILFENFDNEPYEPDLIQNFLNVLFKFLMNPNSSKKVKLGSIKILLIISKIINSFSSQISEANCDKDLKYDCSNTNSKKEKTLIKENFLEFKKIFNLNPNQLITQIELLSGGDKQGLDLILIANFLRFYPDLEKEKIGIFLGHKNEKNQKVYDAYLDTFNFTNMNLADALRNFLFCFKISGESQIIDRIITKFSLKYFEDNLNTKEGIFFENSDSTYYLSFNIMILHTNLHNQNVPIKDRLSVNSFAKTLDNLNGGKYFDFQFLKGIYENIQKNKFFIYDFIQEMEKEKMKIFMNECFGIKINLSNSGDKKWKYISNNLQIKMCANQIIKIILNNLITNIETIFDSNVNQDKEFYKNFFDFFVYFLENILNNLNLESEKVSLIGIWISLIDFKNLETVDKKLVRCLKIFIKTIVTKFFLFDGCWPKIFNFILTKHILIERRNSSFFKNEESSHILKKLSRTFTREKIEKIFLSSSFLSEEDFLEFVLIMFEILQSDLENTSFLNLFLLNQIEMILSSYKKKEKIWAKILNKIKVIVGMLSNYDWVENNSSFIDFFIKISEMLISQNEIKIVEENGDLYLEILFQILSLNNFEKNLKIKILDSLEIFFSYPKILIIFFEKIKFTENLINYFKTYDVQIQNKILEIIRNVISVCKENKIYFIIDEKLFLLFRHFFYDYPNFYIEYLKILINPIFLHEYRGIFLKFLDHIGSLIEENKNNIYEGETVYIFLNQVLKLLLEASLQFNFEEIFFDIVECATSSVLKVYTEGVDEEDKILILSKIFNDFTCEFFEILDVVTFSQITNETKIKNVLCKNLLNLLENIFISDCNLSDHRNNFSIRINDYFCVYEKISNLSNKILVNQKNISQSLEILHRFKLIEVRILEKEEINPQVYENYTKSKNEFVTNLSPYLKIKGNFIKTSFYCQMFNYNKKEQFYKSELDFQDTFLIDFLNLVFKEIKIFDNRFLQQIKELEKNISENLFINYLETVLVNFTNLLNLILIIINCIVSNKLKFDYSDFVSQHYENILNILQHIINLDVKFPLGNFIIISTDMLSLLRTILDDEKCLKIFYTKEFTNTLIKCGVVDDKSFRKKLIEIQLALNLI